MTTVLTVFNDLIAACVVRIALDHKRKLVINAALVLGNRAIRLSTGSITLDRSTKTAANSFACAAEPALNA